METQNNNIPLTKDLVKNHNYAEFSHYRQGNFYYNIKYFHENGMQVEEDPASGGDVNYDMYQFIVPDTEIGNGTLETIEKAITLMRWINESHKEGTLIKI